MIPAKIVALKLSTICKEVSIYLGGILSCLSVANLMSQQYCVFFF